VTADRDREYFMSFKYQNNVKAHMVVCHERNAFQVLVSSNVVPPRNPMDGLAPHSIEGMVPWPKGRQSVILRHTLKNEESLFGLETGRPVCSLGCLGRTQTTGDIPLRWARYGGNLSFVIAFDPEKDKPSLILRNANPKAGWSPGDGWKDERPLVDATPDLASGIVAPVIRDGKLWILKWRGESSGKTSRRAEDLQLACVDIASGKKIFVPLGYGAPRLRGGGSRIGSGPFFTDLTQPLFLPESLTCTPQGLFFTILCWIDAYGADVRSFGPALSPALHHIRWADVDAWIGKAHPGFGKPSAGRKSAVSP